VEELYIQTLSATFFAVSDFTRQMLIKAGVKENRIINTYNGVDMGNLTCQNGTKTLSETKLAFQKTLFLSVLWEESITQGQEVLIKAIPHILKKHQISKS